MPHIQCDTNEFGVAFERNVGLLERPAISALPDEVWMARYNSPRQPAKKPASAKAEILARSTSRRLALRNGIELAPTIPSGTRRT